MTETKTQSAIRIQLKDSIGAPYTREFSEFIRSDKNQRRRKLGEYSERPMFLAEEVLITPISYEVFSKRYTISPHLEKLLGYVHSRARFEESSQDLLDLIRTRRDFVLDTIPTSDILEILVAQHGYLHEYAFHETLRDVGCVAETIIILEEMLGEELLGECIKEGLVEGKFDVEKELDALLLIENRKLGEYAQRLSNNLSYLHYDPRGREIELSTPTVDPSIIDEMQSRAKYVEDLLKMKSDAVNGIAYARSERS